MSSATFKDSKHTTSTEKTMSFGGAYIVPQSNGVTMMGPLLLKHNSTQSSGGDKVPHATVLYATEFLIQNKETTASLTPVYALISKETKLLAEILPLPEWDGLTGSTQSGQQWIDRKERVKVCAVQKITAPSGNTYIQTMKNNRKNSFDARSILPQSKLSLSLNSDSLEGKNKDETFLTDKDKEKKKDAVNKTKTKMGVEVKTIVLDSNARVSSFLPLNAKVTQARPKVPPPMKPPPIVPPPRSASLQNQSGAEEEPENLEPELLSMKKLNDLTSNITDMEKNTTKQETVDKQNKQMNEGLTFQTVSTSGPHFFSAQPTEVDFKKRISSKLSEPLPGDEEAEELPKYKRGTNPLKKFFARKKGKYDPSADGENFESTLPSFDYEMKDGKKKKKTKEKEGKKTKKTESSRPRLSKDNIVVVISSGKCLSDLNFTLDSPDSTPSAEDDEKQSEEGFDIASGTENNEIDNEYNEMEDVGVYANFPTVLRRKVNNGHRVDPPKVPYNDMPSSDQENEYNVPEDNEDNESVDNKSIQSDDSKSSLGEDEESNFDNDGDDYVNTQLLTKLNISVPSPSKSPSSATSERSSANSGCQGYYVVNSDEESPGKIEQDLTIHGIEDDSVFLEESFPPAPSESELQEQLHDSNSSDKTDLKNSLKKFGTLGDLSHKDSKDKCINDESSNCRKLNTDEMKNKVEDISFNANNRTSVSIQHESNGNKQDNLFIKSIYDQTQVASLETKKPDIGVTPETKFTIKTQVTVQSPTESKTQENVTESQRKDSKVNIESEKPEIDDLERESENNQLKSVAISPSSKFVEKTKAHNSSLNKPDITLVVPKATDIIKINTNTVVESSPNSKDCENKQQTDMIFNHEINHKDSKIEMRTKNGVNTDKQSSNVLLASHESSSGKICTPPPTKPKPPSWKVKHFLTGAEKTEVPPIPTKTPKPKLVSRGSEESINKKLIAGALKDLDEYIDKEIKQDEVSKSDTIAPILLANDNGKALGSDHKDYEKFIVAYKQNATATKLKTNILKKSTNDDKHTKDIPLNAEARNLTLKAESASMDNSKSNEQTPTESAIESSQTGRYERVVSFSVEGVSPPNAVEDSKLGKKKDNEAHNSLTLPISADGSYEDVVDKISGEYIIENGEKIYDEITDSEKDLSPTSKCFNFHWKKKDKEGAVKKDEAEHDTGTEKYSQGSKEKKAKETGNIKTKGDIIDEDLKKKKKNNVSKTSKSRKDSTDGKPKVTSVSSSHSSEFSADSDYEAVSDQITVQDKENGQSFSESITRRHNNIEPTKVFIEHADSFGYEIPAKLPVINIAKNSKVSLRKTSEEPGQNETNDSNEDVGNKAKGIVSNDNHQCDENKDTLCLHVTTGPDINLQVRQDEDVANIQSKTINQNECDIKQDSGLHVQPLKKLTEQNELPEAKVTLHNNAISKKMLQDADKKSSVNLPFVKPTVVKTDLHDNKEDKDKEKKKTKKDKEHDNSSSSSSESSSSSDEGNAKKEPKKLTVNLPSSTKAHIQDSLKQDLSNFDKNKAATFNKETEYKEKSNSSKHESKDVMEANKKGNSELLKDKKDIEIKTSEKKLELNKTKSLDQTLKKPDIALLTNQKNSNIINFDIKSDVKNKNKKQSTVKKKDEKVVISPDNLKKSKLDNIDSQLTNTSFNVELVGNRSPTLKSNIDDDTVPTNDAVSSVFQIPCIQSFSEIDDDPWKDYSALELGALTKSKELLATRGKELPQPLKLNYSEVVLYTEDRTTSLPPDHVAPPVPRVRSKVGLVNDMDISGLASARINLEVNNQKEKPGAGSDSDSDIYTDGTSEAANVLILENSINMNISNFGMEEHQTVDVGCGDFLEPPADTEESCKENGDYDHVPVRMRKLVNAKPVFPGLVVSSTSSSPTTSGLFATKLSHKDHHSGVPEYAQPWEEKKLENMPSVSALAAASRSSSERSSGVDAVNSARMSYSSQEIKEEIEFGLESSLKMNKMSPKTDAKYKTSSEDGQKKNRLKSFTTMFHRKKKAKKETVCTDDEDDDSDNVDNEDSSETPGRSKGKQKGEKSKRRKSSKEENKKEKPKKLSKKDKKQLSDLEGMEMSTGTMDKMPICQLIKVCDDGSKLMEMVRPQSEPLGIFFKKGPETHKEGLVVKSFLDKQAKRLFADLLRVGDEIIEIDDDDIRHMTLDEIKDLIQTKETMVLKIRSTTQPEK